MRNARVFEGLVKPALKKWLFGCMDAEEEVYFNAAEAIKYGFTDHILGENGCTWEHIFDEDNLWF